jgi:hypothetical protein
VILDPCTTTVAFRRVLPLPSSRVAAWMRMAGACATERRRGQEDGKQNGVEAHAAHYNPRILGKNLGGRH